MRKHFVTFYSPGSFMAETTTREVSEWSTHEAMKLAASVKERYNAIPYGFKFDTRIVHDPTPDGEGGTIKVESKVVDTSGMYFINGLVQTVEDIEALNDPSNSILISNMRCNGYDKVVTTKNGYRWTQPLNEKDCVVDSDGEILYKNA